MYRPRTTLYRPSNVVDFLDWHAYAICVQMRDDEIRQYRALSWGGEYDAQVAARSFINRPGIKFSLVDDNGAPLVIGGYDEIFPEVWNSWMAATKESWHDNWRTITKASRWAMHSLFETGARRLETLVLTDRRQTIEWYERSLGLKFEGIREGFALGGEDVSMFGLTRRQYYGIEQ